MEVQTQQIAPGVKMPVISIASDNLEQDQVAPVVEDWLELGGRGIDTSTIHGHQKMVGEAILRSEIDRKDIFLTTKIYDCNDSKVENWAAHLHESSIDYVDLLLIHRPENKTTDCTLAWAQLEELFEQNITRAIGVSDFLEETLELLLKNATIVPHVNQLKLNIFKHERKMIDLSAKYDITVQSHSPLGDDNNDVLTLISENPAIKKIAEFHEVTSYQVAMKWLLQHHYLLTFEFISEKIEASDADMSGFTLSDDEMEELDGLSKIQIGSPTAAPSKKEILGVEMSGEEASAVRYQMEIGTKTIAPGVEMPVISFGCDNLKGNQVEERVKNWLELGGRGFDTSFANFQGRIGTAIAEYAGKINRKDIFLTTKVPDCNHLKVANRLKRDLQLLDTDYVDLLLIQYPTGGDCTLAWAELEKALASNQTRAIGVTHFSEKKLESLLENAKIIPHVVQIETNILEAHNEMIALLSKNSITVQSHSPLGASNNTGNNVLNFLSENHLIQKVAENHESSVYQVAMKWILQHGWLLTFEPILDKLEASDADMSGFTLSKDEMKMFNRFSDFHRVTLEPSAPPSQSLPSTAPSEREKLKIGTKTIAPDVKMPIISIGDNTRATTGIFKQTVEDWLEIGGRGIAVPTRWGAVRQAGIGIKAHAGKIDRKDIFLTSKVNCEDEDQVGPDLKRILGLMNTDYIDLLLLRKIPGMDCTPAWVKLEEIFVSNKARAIGVEDFEKEDLELLLEKAKVIPHVHEFELNIFKANPETIDFSTENGIVVQSYSPFGVGYDTTQELLVVSDNPLIQRIAEDHQVTTYQVAMKYIVQHGWLLNLQITPDKLKTSHVDISGFTLNTDEMNMLDILSGVQSIPSPLSAAPSEKWQIDIETKRIGSGVEMPVISVEGNKEVIMENWLELGGRGIDVWPQDEFLKQTGAAIKKYSGKIHREDIFLTVKFTNCKQEQFADRIKRELGLLDTHYVDLLILHPDSEEDCIPAWIKLEELFVSNQARAIGVKDFEKERLELLLEKAKIIPHVNQLELNVLKTNSEMIDFLTENGIVLQSSSPFGSGVNITEDLANISENQLIQKISKKYGVTTYQVAMKWILQHRWLLTFRSSNKFERNDADMSGFRLTNSEMKKLDGLSDIDLISTTASNEYSNANRVCGSGCKSAVMGTMLCLLLVVLLTLKRKFYDKRKSNAANAEHVNVKDGLYKDFPEYHDYPTPNKNPPFGEVYKDFPRKPPKDDKKKREKDLKPTEEASTEETPTEGGVGYEDVLTQSAVLT